MWLKAAILTLIIESITIFMRFGLELQSTRDTTFLARYTFGLRIHHGYIGVVILIIVFLLGSRETAWSRDWLSAIGWALLLSDLIHHFVVLWIFTGSPEFHLWYPGYRK